MPFGLTNAVACFQRIMNNLVKEYSLQGTVAYLDNIIIGGETQEEHDNNVEKFMLMIKELGITLNKDKSVCSVTTLNALGYCISHGKIKPDPERLQPLLDLAPPANTSSLKRIIGMFSYYSEWIYQFSTKISPLADANKFPLDEDALHAFNILKNDLSNAVLHSINDEDTLVLETDASDCAVAATLNQNGRPIAFFSQTPNPSERNHTAVEKEAYAIAESIRKWRHYLSTKHFVLLTDRKYVSFMFNKSNHGKIKNDKILRWRIELSPYSFDIKYRPGKDNIAADTFSRAFCSSLINLEYLEKLHQGYASF